MELPLLVVVAIGLLVFGRTGHRFTRWEGLALVAAYAGYLTFAVLRATV